MATIIYPAQCAQIAKYWKEFHIWTECDQKKESGIEMNLAIGHDFNPIMLILRFWPKKRTSAQNIALYGGHLLHKYRAKQTYHCSDKSI